MKKITIAAKPTMKPKERPNPDQWVESANRLDPDEPIKRFTIDVPASLHQRVKTGCAMQGLKMTEVMRGLLEERFPPKTSE